ncbi:hypothetical protein CCR83_12265 [Rhodobacter veldkampii DSM 11550]|uniref:Inositol monophosphatase n=1 Tax=Phaeovulum veldkampii DSM 11550 TaxID=1185920 RepID=A0A2T4JIE8_9RHOB|nr:inositol monophosphatase family protein [Phaeovulum veldkampii]MBK5947191.1 hypothetical protein [Phaeovulum veldkampii DSM 11550]PTE17648.1 inositol monophosphatase [Phaeovulum veldkampii DSM 11550]TDQ57522.1 histidinol phosphatase-like enzyme (inositol monophosphatase family) [Phaeovulum veldkampii DSM 11550]
MTGLNAASRGVLIGAARQIMQAARDVPMDHFRKALAVEAKADESPVTAADRATEARLRAEISARFPDHGIYGEEYGAHGMEAEFLWIIDPIDGTKSFISGHPMWGMLLGLLYRGAPVLGVVQMPALGEIAWGGPRIGAFLNGAPIAARQGVALDRAFVCINEMQRIFVSDRAALERLLRVARYARPTADCYSYVQLAAGWVDAVVDHGLEPYDYLPVLPLVEAAGCVMTDWQGRPLDFQSDGRVVAAPPALHAELLAQLAPG